MYITQEQLVDRYGQAEIARLANTIKDDDAINTAISDATNEINSCVGVQRYLPLAFIPKSLSRACAIIARYYLYTNKRPDDVVTDYDNIIKWLDKLTSRKAVLLDDDGNPIPESDVAVKEHFKSGACVV